MATPLLDLDLESSAPPAAPDLTACDREPIHIPGAIQPHGLLLIADGATRKVIAGAGDIEGRLTPNWLGRELDALLAQPVVLSAKAGEVTEPLAAVPGRHETFGAMVHVVGKRLLVELEPAPADPTPAEMALARLDHAGGQLERAGDLQALCERAATIFRAITRYDRVMIYRFLDDGAGVVIAEDKDAQFGSFLNHRFPASDIPQQARALYVRNRVRVISDVGCTAAPIRPAEHAGIDLSDVGVRSVSPIHVQYLVNMGVRASASISIVKDGLLWGMVACHNMTPLPISHEARMIGATLASGMARQIRAKEEAESYRDRIRLRAAEDAVMARIDPTQPFEAFLAAAGEDLRAMMGADGFAVIEGKRVFTTGRCPEHSKLRDLGRWLADNMDKEPFATRSLASRWPLALDFVKEASGVLASKLPSEQGTMLIWLRAEERELVEWAGNPHKNSASDPEAILTPRTSFETWSEEVHAKARAWSLGEIEAASRLRRQLFAARQSRRLHELNRELGATVADKEALLVQKDHLLREVNHRVQNSLQLVQSFLALQAGASATPDLAESLAEAQRRISAVALVHRRLYQAEQVDTVDLGRYLDELIGEMRGAMGEEWAEQLRLDLAPMLISADRAVHVGLVLTELIINANKYAYGGGSGPLAISLEQYRNQFRLIVADGGSGPTGDREGFGSRMMKAMVQRLGGTIERSDNGPGLRVLVSAPIDE